MDYDSEQLDDSTHSSVIGFAFDGYAIYGVYGWDEEGNVKEMTSSYRLKEGANGYGGIDDYEYVEGLGDMDECNGHFGPTPDALEGHSHYHYHTTLKNGEGALGFPYFVLCYHGIVEEGNLGLGAGPAGGPVAEGPPDEVPNVDLNAAARQLGVTVEALFEALGDERPPDFAASARRLGVDEEELRGALGAPGGPP